MPAKSKAQYGLMAATLGGASTGIPKSTAKEFVTKTPAAKRSAFTSSLLKKKKKKI
jgi:hypothetical protein